MYVSLPVLYRMGCEIKYQWCTTHPRPRFSGRPSTPPAWWRCASRETSRRTSNTPWWKSGTNRERPTSCLLILKRWSLFQWVSLFLCFNITKISHLGGYHHEKFAKTIDWTKHNYVHFVVGFTNFWAQSFCNCFVIFCYMSSKGPISPAWRLVRDSSLRCVEARVAN